MKLVRWSQERLEVKAQCEAGIVPVSLSCLSLPGGLASHLFGQPPNAYDSGFLPQATQEPPTQ